VSRRPVFENVQRFVVTAAIALLVSCFLEAAEAVDKVVRVGFVARSSAPARLPGVAAFWERLAELGYVEGRNLIIEQRWADGKVDRLPALMAEVVTRKVDVLVT
jgi:putative ABC transport system substrate-binding protein